MKRFIRDVVNEMVRCYMNEPWTIAIDLLVALTVTWLVVCIAK